MKEVITRVEMHVDRTVRVALSDKVACWYTSSFMFLLSVRPSVR